MKLILDCGQKLEINSIDDGVAATENGVKTGMYIYQGDDDCTYHFSERQHLRIQKARADGKKELVYFSHPNIFHKLCNWLCGC